MAKDDPAAPPANDPAAPPVENQPPADTGEQQPPADPPADPAPPVVEGICAECFPLGAPEGYTSFGCEHGSWSLP